MRRPSSRIHIFYGSLKDLRLLSLFIFLFLTVRRLKVKTRLSLGDDEASSEGEFAGN